MGVGAWPPVDWPTLETFGRRPREALMWTPRALDVARIASVCQAAGGPVADVGAGTGLLARLVEGAGVPVRALDPKPPVKRYHEVEVADAAALPRSGVALVSWMEAGKDYREAVARAAPVVVNAYDVEGGCGVMGAVDFAPFGFSRVLSWRTPSFEDVEFCLDRPGRGLHRKGHPGNRVDVLTRDDSLAERLAAAVEDARASAPLPWEAEMDALKL